MGNRFIYGILVLLVFTFISQPVSAVDKNNDFRFRFAVISDIHLDADADDDPEYFKLLHQSEDLLRITISEINSLNLDNDSENDIDFVLFTGDNINSRSTDDYKLLSEILADLDAPFYMVPGDWDFSIDFSPRVINRFFNIKFDNLNENVLFEDAGLPGLKKYDFSIDVQNNEGEIIHLIGMDNVLHFDGNRGSFEVEQLAWLESDLEKNSDLPIVIMIHCPVISPYSEDAGTPLDDIDWMPYTMEISESNEIPKNRFTSDIPWKKDRAADRSQDFLDLVEKYDVPLVLMGDFHLNKKYFYPADKPEALLAINPALVSYPCAYTIYEFSQDEITWEVRQIEKYIETCRSYDYRSLNKYNSVYGKIGAESLMYNIVKTMALSWGSDVGDQNDWEGSFPWHNFLKK